MCPRRFLRRSCANVTPRVVAQHVDGTEALAGGRSCRRPTAQRCDIELKCDRVTAELPRLLLRVPELDIREHELHSLLGERLRDAAANPAAAAGDECNRALELHDYPALDARRSKGFSPSFPMGVLASI